MESFRYLFSVFLVVEYLQVVGMNSVNPIKEDHEKVGGTIYLHNFLR